MSLLAGLRVLEIGPGLGAAVAGRLFADAGAEVACLGADTSTPLAAYLAHGKGSAGSLTSGLRETRIVLLEGTPAGLEARGLAVASLRALSDRPVLVLISPFGQTGPDAERPASDLTLCAASGIARLLTGQVDDLSEPPVRPAGEQSAFIAGLAAACAGMHAALLPGPGAAIDVSTQEALATLAISELARAGLMRRTWSRRRLADGNGATVCILPARDGYAAISPREDHQWAAWLEVMGAPAWGQELRFRTKADRGRNWDALHALMSEWSRRQPKQAIVEAAQGARVPSLPLAELAEQLRSPQLAHRGFFRALQFKGRTIQVPSAPFGHLEDAAMTVPERVEGRGLPLTGIRVLDFSWVIAGPTTTRHLAAMGAEVIKVEAPGRGDPGRGSELHTVLGQGKRAIVLDLKQPRARSVARALAARADIVIENFATGVMERLGLGAEALRAENSGLIYISASGFGRSGPESGRAAYGTLLQCYAGFAGLNGHEGVAPRIGMAWLDPMCGLMLAFAAAAGIWRRRSGGGGSRIDFSMFEAMLWTLAGPLIAAQTGTPPRRCGNASKQHTPHGVFAAKGEDAWLALAVTTQDQWRALSEIVPGLAPLATLGAAERRARTVEIDAALGGWIADQSAEAAESRLRAAAVPAAAITGALDLADSPHLKARDFWEADEAGLLPGLPWKASFGRAGGPAPGLGADTEAVLAEVLGLSATEIESLGRVGALGQYSPLR